MTAVNSRDVTYWCVYLRDNKKIRTSKQNSRESLRSILQPILFKNFACGTNLSELLDDATVCYHSPLEERLGAKWFHNRMVSIGDSVHKVSPLSGVRASVLTCSFLCQMVPNLGQGGNMAIQDATTLASCLADLKSISPRPTTAEIHQCLDTWQKIRFDTVQRAWNASHWLIRLETFSSTKDFILGRFIVPLLDNYIANQLCTILQGEDTHQEQPPENYQSSLLGFLKHYLLYFWGFEMLRS